jgi:uncharacterized repeat protein (TIGR01451 family)
MIFRRFIILVSILLGLGGSVFAQSGIPEVNERIRNQAVTTFYDREAGYPVRLYSNTVQAVIAPKHQVYLENETSLKAVAGSQFRFIHYILNKGNMATGYRIWVELAEQNPYGLQNVKVRIIESASRQVIAELTDPFQEYYMASQIPGQIYEIEITGWIDRQAQEEERSELTLHLESQQNVQQSRTNDITVSEGAYVVVTKKADKTTARPGETVTFAIEASNNGSDLAQAVPVSVDGQPASYVLIRDVIPANTVFDSLISHSQAKVFYHLEGQPDYEFFSWSDDMESWEIDEIIFGLPSLRVGEAFKGSFMVRVMQAASGKVHNTAEVVFKNETGSISIASSNHVSIPINENIPELAYYHSDAFDKKAKSSRIGQPLFLMAEASSCNESRKEADEIKISLRSALTTDYEVFLAYETGRNTGIFVIPGGIPTQSVNIQSAVKLNGTLETTDKDKIEASILDCGPNNYQALALMRMNPVNIVYDSRNNRPVAGALVSLIRLDESKQKEATGDVFDVDQETPMPATVVTNEEGKFEYPSVRNGEYQVVVTPPSEYTFPSRLMWNLLPVDRETHPEGSYGSGFFHIDDGASVSMDIPVDGSPNTGLRIEKTSVQKNVMLGDFVDYRIKIKNESGISLEQVTLKDELPFGFSYTKGTAYFEGERLADPAGDKGPVLEFLLGTIDDETELELTYRTLAGPGAMQGDGINSAQAYSPDPMPKMSNVSRAEVKLQGGVFSDRGFLTGTVFLDANKNGLKEADEPGIPYVRLVLENGTFVITDGNGKYSLYGLTPETHVLKIDPITLPDGTIPLLTDSRQARNAYTRFIDLEKGGLQNINIPLCPVDLPPYDEIKQRKHAFETGTELETSLNTSFRFEDAGPGNTAGKSAEGYVGVFKDLSEDSAKESVSTITTETADSTTVRLPLSASSRLELAGIASDDTLTASQVTLFVQSRMGSTVKLTVNGKGIPDEQIGSQSSVASRQVQITEYVGIQMTPGKNEIKLEAFDTFGNLREESQYDIFAAGPVRSLQMVPSVKRLPANGRSVVLVTPVPVDSMGLVNNSELPVTLKASAGTWLVTDLNETEPGIQTFIRGTQTRLQWQSPRTPGAAVLEMASGTMDTKAQIEVTPDLRPFIAAGIVEGTVSLNQITRGRLTPSAENDGFYRELEAFAYRSNNGEITAGARTSFYLKGKILGKYLLTMSYDSEKKDEPLFRDIQPDEFYPIYGDASVRGYDAQSSEKFYVRLDDRRSYIQYGDYLTQEHHPARELGRYSRSQTGLKSHYETNRVLVNAYGTIANSSQKIDEWPAEGISGPFYLSAPDIIPNSEQVSILTRDLEQPGLILETRLLTRFVDYTLDAFTGTLLLNEAVASYDAGLNPNSIRVIYEAETGEESYVSGGVDLQAKVTKSLEAGISAVEDRNPANALSMQSGNITAQLQKDTYVIGEVARSDDAENGTGKAGRIELKHNSRRAELRLHGLTSDTTFSNPSSSLQNGKTEIGAKGRYKIKKSHIKGEYLYSDVSSTGQIRQGGMAALETSVKEVNVEVGTRISTFENGSTGQSGDNVTVRSQVTTKVPGLAKAEIFGEYEQDVRAADRKIIGAGGTYKINGRSRLYLRHEFISSLGSRYALNSIDGSSRTVLGVDAAYRSKGKAFSEYRIRDGINGREAQAAIGLRNRWEIADGININAGVEHTRQSGSTDRKNIALTGAIAYTASENWKGSSRMEFRRNNASNFYLNTIGAGYRLSESWTLLGKNFLGITDYRNDTPTLIQNRSRIGAAYRDYGRARLDALLRYEYKMEKKSDTDWNGTHIASAHSALQPLRRLNLSGRVAGKYVKDRIQELDTEALLYLLSARAVFQVYDNWDMGIQGNLLAGKSSRKYGLGIEAGYTVAQNLRAVVGYNFFGFKDRDLVESNSSQKGVFLKLSFKFDEQLFAGLIPDRGRYPDYQAGCSCEPAPVKVLKLDSNFATLPEPEVPSFTARPLPGILLPRAIHFATGQIEIDSVSARVLEPVVSYLTEKDSVNVAIVGTADVSGSDVYNKLLSLRRAVAVKAYLEGYGIEGTRILVSGIGETGPEGEADTIRSRAYNRRAIFLLYGAHDAVLVDQDRDLKGIENQPSIAEEKR